MQKEISPKCEPKSTGKRTLHKALPPIAPGAMVSVETGGNNLPLLRHLLARREELNQERDRLHAICEEIEARPDRPAESEEAYEEWRIASGHFLAEADVDRVFRRIWAIEDEILSLPAKSIAEVALKLFVLEKGLEEQDGWLMDEDSTLMAVRSMTPFFRAGGHGNDRQA